jgi:hypothetical protein
MVSQAIPIPPGYRSLYRPGDEFGIKRFIDAQLPPEYAGLATASNPFAGIVRMVDDKYQKTGQLPSGFKVENGHAVETQPGWLHRNLWVIPAIAVSVGLAAPVLAGGSGAAAGGAGGAAGVSSGAGGAAGIGATSAASGGVEAGVTSGVTAGLPGAGTALPAITASGAATAGIGKWLSPFLSTVVPTIGQLAGAGIQAGGIKDAAEIQAKSFADALAYEKQRDQYLQNLEASRYSDLTGRLEPYIATGQTANDRMATLLGINPQEHGYTMPSQLTSGALRPAAPAVGAGQTVSAPPPTAAPPMNAPPAGGNQYQPTVQPVRAEGPQIPAASGTEPTVLMQAPDGSTRQIPQSQQQHFEQLGAKVVSNG